MLPTQNWRCRDLLCWLETTSLFPAKNQTSPSAYVEIYYGKGVTYTQICTLMLSTHCSDVSFCGWAASNIIFDIRHNRHIRQHCGNHELCLWLGASWFVPETPGSSLLNQVWYCLKKTTSWWQKGMKLAVKLGYGKTVLVALEEERGEVDTYMVLSSY